MKDLKTACDAVLHGVTAGAARVPGVVAMVTDRDGTLYSGAAGERRPAFGEVSSRTSRRQPMSSSSRPRVSFTQA